MHKKSYSIGIVGAGMISAFFIQALSKRKDARFSAICDTDHEKLKPFSVKGIATYRDYKSLLQDSGLDAVIVVTPNHTHADIIRLALLSGKHVLCEKPLALDLPQTIALVDLAKRQNLLLMTAFHRRYNINVQKLVTDLKAAGPVRSITVRYLEDIAEHSQSDWYFDVEKSGGGCVIDNGINAIDLLQYMVGPLELVNADIEFKTISGKKYDSGAFIKLKHGKGDAHIELDWHFKGETKDIQATCSGKKIFECDMLRNYNGFKESLWHEYEGVVSDFIGRLNRGEYIDDAGLNAMRIVRDIYEFKP